MPPPPASGGPGEVPEANVNTILTSDAKPIHQQTDEAQNMLELGGHDPLAD